MQNVAHIMVMYLMMDLAKMAICNAELFHQETVDEIEMVKEAVERDKKEDASSEPEVEAGLRKTTAKPQGDDRFTQINKAAKCLQDLLGDPSSLRLSRVR